jgi:hypothetical protein
MGIIKRLFSFKRWNRETFIPLPLPPSIQTINYCEYTRKLVNIQFVCEPIEKRIECLIQNIFYEWYDKIIENNISDDELHTFLSDHKIPKEKYIDFIDRAIKLSTFIRDNIETIFISTLIYINKLSPLSINKHNIFYLFIISFCLSIKYNFDPLDHISTLRIIKHLFHINMKKEKYNELEVAFLKAVNYNLFICPEKFLIYYKKMKLTN